jgi:hypothetical protein
MCVYKIWRKTQLRHLTVSGIIKNIYLAELSEAGTLTLKCNVGSSFHSLVYRLVYVPYNVRETE